MSRSVAVNTGGNPTTRYVNEFPSKCGLCHKNVDPTFVSGVFIRGNPDTSKQLELTFQCTNNKCNSLIIGYYDANPRSEKSFNLKKYAPINPTKDNFNEEIGEVSNNFIKIYNQSLHAEQIELNLISGIGYRKAIEFLIKDYLIYLDESQEEKITDMPLGQCINMLDNNNIKEIAKRASWIGNDEAHYVRKWKDKDIIDLKKLIEVTVYFISMDVSAKKYLEEMS